ncbi:Cdc6/Cdc18 family protein [Natronorubrum texcoconense]|uniref:Orc1/cdc6 family replication initiation protein n=1 Tax=Natronorubrum texcoconense TaxID=1095776 RepID=A0A1G8V912_9EURY|nr:Cdc6/Cdc18 family protein [Natronorubrum texcoconense]SDJ62394.1 orc1/cdc6 family replication initiation protein [Natronorubrum texcoconense]
MIRDARVLQPEFVPRDIVHRTQEVNTLSNALEPVMEGNAGETAFLYGPSGTGKTCIAQFVAERLRENVIDINYQYVNCWEDYSRFKTLYRILEGIDRTLDIHRQSTPKDELLERLHAHEGAPYVIILDEVDQLEDKSVLYELYRTRGLTMVLIANQETELFASLNERLTSRLRTAIRIDFDRYSVEELVAILEDRVRWGLREDTVTDGQLELIADAAAGDARVGIEVLRVAARRATQQGLDTISDEVIETSVSEAKSEIRQRNVEKLIEEQRILYEIITEEQEIAPSDLYEQYRERAEEPKSDRMVRNYLQKMQRYNLIKATGENRGRTYVAL